MNLSQTTPAIKGLITACTMIVASMVSFYLLKNPVESYFQFVVYTIYLLGIIWALFYYFKNGNPAKKSFKDYFSIGFKTFVVVVLLMALYTFIFFSFNTAFRDEKIAENSRLLLIEGNHLSNEVAENAVQLKKMFMPLMVSSAIFRYLIIGAIVTAITSGFFSSKKIG